MATDTSPVVVNPLLPECLDGHLTLEDFNAEDAVEFRPDDFSYYKGVLTSIVPGIVLGCLAAIAMIGVIIWVCLIHDGCILRGIVVAMLCLCLCRQVSPFVVAVAQPEGNGLTASRRIR